MPITAHYSADSIVATPEIIRSGGVEKREPWLRVPSALIDDPTLSLNAKALLMVVADRGEAWVLRSAWLKNCWGWGRQTYYREKAAAEASPYVRTLTNSRTACRWEVTLPNADTFAIIHRRALRDAEMTPRRLLILALLYDVQRGPLYLPEICRLLGMRRKGGEALSRRLVSADLRWLAAKGYVQSSGGGRSERGRMTATRWGRAPTVVQVPKSSHPDDIQVPKAAHSSGVQVPKSSQPGPHRVPPTGFPGPDSENGTHKKENPEARQTNKEDTVSSRSSSPSRTGPDSMLDDLCRRIRRSDSIGLIDNDAYVNQQSRDALKEMAKFCGITSSDDTWYSDRAEALVEVIEAVLERVQYVKVRGEILTLKYFDKGVRRDEGGALTLQLSYERREQQRLEGLANWQSWAEEQAREAWSYAVKNSRAIQDERNVDLMNGLIMWACGDEWDPRLGPHPNHLTADNELSSDAVRLAAQILVAAHASHEWCPWEIKTGRLRRITSRDVHHLRFLFNDLFCELTGFAAFRRSSVSFHGGAT